MLEVHRLRIKIYSYLDDIYSMIARYKDEYKQIARYQIYKYLDMNK